MFPFPCPSTWYVLASREGAPPTAETTRRRQSFPQLPFPLQLPFTKLAGRGPPYYLLQRVRAIQDRSWSIVRVRIVHRDPVYICPAETIISRDHWWVDPLCCGGHNNNHCNCLMILNHCSIGLIVSPIQNVCKNILQSKYLTKLLPIYLHCTR